MKPRIRKWPRPHSCEQAISYSPMRFGMNHTGIVIPGIASCFTRISYSPKLWMTSLLERCTSTGRSIGRFS